MTPFEKLWAYAIKQYASIINAGFGKYEVIGNPEQKDKIAAKAIRLGMYVLTERRPDNCSGYYDYMEVSY